MEADGTLLILRPQAALPELLATRYAVSWNAVERLFKLAGIRQPLKEINPFGHPGEALPTEGAEEMWGGVVVYTLSMDWMPLAKALVESGQNIEFYGFINLEGTNIEYYAVNDQTRFTGEYATESDEQNTAKIEWLKLLPNDIREYFSAATAEGEDD